MIQLRGTIWCGLLVWGASSAAIADDTGELTADLVGRLRSSFRMDAATRTKHNAVTNNDINRLALNREALNRYDRHFSHRIEFKGITNQKASGRCWLFAGLNTVRPAVLRDKGLERFEFSAAYLQFWDKMEKSNLYLESMIELRDADFLDRRWQLVQEWALSDGGWWNYVVALVEKYGAVPKDVMPETHSSDNTRIMNRVLERKLRADAARMHALYRRGAKVGELREFKLRSLAEVYRFLVINLGEPPASFEWRYRTKKKGGDDAPEGPVTEQRELQALRRYTPREFYRTFVGVDLSRFVCLYSDPVNAYDRHYRFDRSRNIVGAEEMHFVNIETGRMKEIAMKAVLANEPVWFAADVGRDQSTEHGLMVRGLYEYGPLFDLDLEMTKADRIRYMSGGSNHAMVFMGVDVREGRPRKWLVENSWGAKKGDQGTWLLGDEWFDEHVYVIIVDRRHVPGPILEAFKEEPERLPPWYPAAPVWRLSGADPE